MADKYILDEGFQCMLKHIPAPKDCGMVRNYSQALVELESGGAEGVPTEWLASIYIAIKNELSSRGLDIEAGLIRERANDR